MKRSLYFSPRGWLILAGGFILLGLGSGLSFSFGVFLKPLAEDFQWARSDVSLAYSINMLVLGGASFVLGGMADRWGARRVLFLGTLILVVGIFLTSRISALWQFYLFFGVLIGIGKSAFHSPLLAHITRTFHRRRGLAVGLVFAGAGVGLFVVAPVTRYLITQVGWRVTFVIMAASFFVLAFPLIWLFREEKPGVSLEVGDGEEGRAAALSKDDPPPERFHWRNRSFWVISGLHYFDCVCHAVPLVHVVAYATDRGIAPGKAAGVLGIIGLMAIFGRIAISGVTDRIGARKGLLLTLIAQTGMIPFLMVSNSLAMFYAFAVLFGFGWGGNSPMYPLLTREYFGTKQLGYIYGLTLVASSFGMAAGGYMGGFLFDISGSYQWAFLFSIAAGVISIALIPLLKPVGKGETREEERKVPLYAAPVGALDH